LPEDDPLIGIDDTHNAPPVKGEDTRTVPFSALSGERRRASEAKRAADAAEARAKAAEERAAALASEIETYKGSHEKWTAYQTAEAERSTKALAERLAALPEDVRADIEADIESGTPAAQVLRWIERAEKMAGTKPVAQAQTGYPSGGRGPSGAPAQDELTPEEAAWVESSRPDLRGVAPAVVKKNFLKLGPKKK
jgi:hypothetical protein